MFLFYLIYEFVCVHYLLFVLYIIIYIYCLLIFNVLRFCLVGAGGLSSALSAGCYLVDFTTSSASLAEEVYIHLKAKGVYALDAPVTGGTQILNPKP